MCCTRNKNFFDCILVVGYCSVSEKMAAAIVLFPRKRLRKCGAFGTFSPLIEILIDIKMSKLTQNKTQVNALNSLRDLLDQMLDLLDQWLTFDQMLPKLLASKYFQ